MVSQPKADKLMLDAETLTVKELAGRLKWHERSVRRLVQQGKLPARLVGTQLRFLWSEVVASLPLAPATASGRASVPGVVALEHVRIVEQADAAVPLPVRPARAYQPMWRLWDWPRL